MSVFENLDINQLNSKYIFVGLNPNPHGLSKAGCKICKCYSNCSRKLDKCNKGCEFCSCLQKCPVNQDVEDGDWKDFHSECKRKTQDHKLRKAFNDINNREYWGSFMIDLYQYNEPNSSKVQKMASEEDLVSAIDILSDVWHKLGCHSTIIAMGIITSDNLKRRIDTIENKGINRKYLKQVRHFSAPGMTSFINSLKMPKPLIIP